MNVKEIFNDIFNITYNIYEDERGSFSEIFNNKLMSKNNIPTNFVQDNLSFSEKSGTLRGLHFQKNPNAQSKLIKVLEGEIEDFFIDLRHDSPTYQKYSSFTLKKDNGWLYIPKGFAHGFCTLMDNTSVLYKVDNYYSQNDETGIIWNDNFFNITWPLPDNNPILSKKDKSLPLWSEIKDKVDFSL